MSSRKSSPRKSMEGVPSDETPLRTNPPHWGDLQNRPPKGTVARWFWKKRIWVESTFALSMLEPWEKILVLCTFLLLWTLLLFSVVYYLPRHVQLIYTRAKYYVLGDENGISRSFIAGQAASREL